MDSRPERLREYLAARIEACVQPHPYADANPERYADADPDLVSVVFAHAVADAVCVADRHQHAKPVVYADSKCDPVRYSKLCGHRNADADPVAVRDVDWHPVACIDANTISHAHAIDDSNSVLHGIICLLSRVRWDAELDCADPNQRVQPDPCDLYFTVRDLIRVPVVRSHCVRPRDVLSDLVSDRRVARICCT